MNRSEQVFHQNAAHFLTVALRAPTWWTTFPAGGGGGLRGSILKGMGLRAGVPDILVLHPGVRLLGIELKAKRGRLSADQLETHEAMTVAGALVCTCKTLEEIEAFLRRHQIPVHGCVQARAA